MVFLFFGRSHFNRLFRRLWVRYTAFYRRPTMRGNRIVRAGISQRPRNVAAAEKHLPIFFDGSHLSEFVVLENLQFVHRKYHPLSLLIFPLYARLPNEFLPLHHKKSRPFWAAFHYSPFIFRLSLYCSASAKYLKSTVRS